MILKIYPLHQTLTAGKRTKAGGTIGVSLEQSQRPWYPLKHIPGASAVCALLVGCVRKSALCSLPEWAKASDRCKIGISQRVQLPLVMKIRFSHVLSSLSEVLSTLVQSKWDFHICLLPEKNSMHILIDDEHWLILGSYFQVIWEVKQIIKQKC